ncbi:hypothetical protein C8A01DRAFT_33427 [Parachaetomium inaequale]|uniref:Uncharacterized protein n=1 Tax=Parachaetomium inaequale TaxID=2588326 RepID=A0AAN6STY9_9PEZI|nr:hypothetical protein C8A01DRAFT_33427 [Parachaetomium inaequale]
MEEGLAQNKPLGRARKLEISARWRRTKAWLNYSIILLCVAQLALAGVQTARSSTGVSIAWSSTEVFIQCLTRNKPFKRYRGIHPGAHIGMHLGLVAAQGTSGGGTTPTRICNPARVFPCVSPETDIAVGTLAFVLCVIHFVLFIRACVETHRLRTGYPHSSSSTPDFVPASNDSKGGENLPEVAVVQKAGSNNNAPVIVPLSIAGQDGTTTDVYMVTGPDGRPQLLAPVGTRLVVVPSEGHQQQQVVAAEAGSAQVYELNAPPARVNELDARQWDRS